MLVTSTVAMFFLNKNNTKIEEKDTHKEQAVQQTKNNNDGLCNSTYVDCWNILFKQE